MRTPSISSLALSVLLAVAGSAVQAAPSQAPVTFEADRPLTADRLVASVIAANPGLAAAEAAADAAAFRVEPAGSLDDPMLSYGVAPLTAGADRSLNQKIDVSQKIPWPGTLAARKAAARHETVVAERDTDALRLRVIAQAKSAHAEWRYVASAMAIHHATLELLDDLLATAETRYAAGRALKQDVLQAEVERVNLDKHLLLLRRQQTTVQARINALLNRAPDAPLPAAAAISVAPPPPAFERLETLALASHPELSRLDAEIAASESRVVLAEKAFYPDFQIGVGYNSLWESVDQRPVVGISINVPLDRGRRRAELDRAHAEMRRSRHSLSGRRAELLAALATTHAETIEAQQSIALYEEELVPLAGEYLEASIADYQSGAGAFLNVITAEQRKLETDLSLARARADYLRYLAELELWAGGSLDAPLPTAAGAWQ